MSTTPQHNENVILRVMAATTQGGVLLYDRTMAWQGVCAEGPGNAASLCTLVSSLGTLAHNMGEAPGTVTETGTDTKPSETGKKVMSVLFDNEAKVSGTQQQRSKTRRARRAVRDDTDTMPCVRLAIAQGQHVALSMFHLANPAPAMRAAVSAAALAQAVDAALCDAVVAFEKQHADDLARLAPRIEVCSKSEGAETLSDEERACFATSLEDIFQPACSAHQLNIFVPE